MKCGFEITVLCSLALAFLIIGDSANLTARQEKKAVDTKPPYFEKILPLPTEQEETIVEEEHHGELEESPTDISFLFYATQPIGRYYITAYNHKETGSKQTASGKTVHQGTITSCAADPKYHRFGEYLEIDGKLYRVEDTGSAVKKRHIDLYFASYRDMTRYGSNYQTIHKVSFPFGVPKDE